MKTFSSTEASCWMLASFLVGCFGMIYLITFTEGTAISNQNKINELIQQCEASLPRNQHCEIVFDTKIIVDSLENK